MSEGKSRKVRIRSSEFFPVFVIEELEEGEKGDGECIKLRDREIAAFKKRHREWEDMQDKLRKLHPWWG